MCGGILRQRKCIAALLAAALVFIPSTVLGDWTNFMPKLFNYNAFLELTSYHDVNKNQVNGNGYKVTDNLFQEKLTLSTDGYVYHPRFLLLNIKVSGVLDQEQFGVTTNGGTGIPWTNSTGFEHDVHLKFLPQHPYNLELLSRHDIVLSPRGVQSGTQTTNQYGGIFTYYETPFAANATYMVMDAKSGGFSSSSPSLSAYVSHSVDFSTTSVTYEHMTSETDFETSGAASRTDTARDNYNFSNTLRYKGATLSSNVNFTRTEQNTVPVQSDAITSFFTVTETLYWRLPWNFQALFRYYHYDTSLDYNLQSTQNKFSNTADNAGFDLSHQLFQSLSTDYNVNITSNRSSDMAKSDSVSQTLTLNYTKKIPFGVMNAGVLGGEIVENRRGALIIINESHSASLTPPANKFVLNHDDADITTIVVKVRIPGTEIDFVLPQVFYLIGSQGGFPSITIFDLPLDPPVKQIGNPNFNYAFTVSYNLLPNNVKLKTILKGYNLQFTLLENLLSPYYRYSSSQQEVLSGTLIGGPTSTETTSIGLIVNKGPFRWLNDYTNMDSTSSPQRQFLSQLDFSKEIAGNTRIMLGVRYVRIRYLTGPQDTVVRNYSETDKMLTASVSKYLPSYNLSGSLAGSYGTSDSLTNSKIYTGNGELTWRTGRLSVTARAEISNMSSNFSGNTATLTSVKTVTTHERYYLQVKRALF